MLARLLLRPVATAIPVIACLAACASPAAASAPTRADYVAAAEPICKEETLGHRGMLRGVEGMVERGQMGLAAHRLIRASSALRGTLGRLAHLRRPVADRERLSLWFRHAGNGSALLRRMGTALRSGDRPQAEDLAATLLRETKRANASVVGFDFDYCRLNPARFA